MFAEDEEGDQEYYDFSQAIVEPDHTIQWSNSRMLQ